jgi:hypothetical protein
MIRENRQLLTDEAVAFEVQDCWKNYRPFQRNVWNIPQFNKGKPEDVNM